MVEAGQESHTVYLVYIKTVTSNQALAGTAGNKSDKDLAVRTGLQVQLHGRDPWRMVYGFKEA